MDIKVTPQRLSGSVMIPPSKSVAHRMIIAAALSSGRSIVSNIYQSVDILATIDCMRQLGADIQLVEDKAIINGIEKLPKMAVLDCHESGSTMRFLIPVVCALGIECTFKGRGKLPTRPITPYLEQFPKHGIKFDLSDAKEGEILPCKVSGKLTAGRFEIGGDISSQFITGLLFALAVLSDDSEIILTSHLQSRPYVDITIGCLREFGVEVTETDEGFAVKGGQVFKAHDCSVEGDYSQAAFFRVANSFGCDIDITGLNEASLQGDRQIMDICRECEGTDGRLRPFCIDCSDIPDLVPILTVLACFCDGRSEIRNVARLRIKESDRLAAISDCLNRLDGKVKAFDDRLEIEGVESLSGGEIDCYNDHRIPMAMSVAAVKCRGPLILRGAECISKSYPNFFEHYNALGGKAEEI